MIGFQLSELARELPAELMGADAQIQGVSSDSRRLAPGQLFVALKGPRFDGHDYLDAAAARGAAGALVSDRPSDALPCLRVADTRRALGRVAALWRARARAKVVAVTGSNGKTTVKELLAAILRRHGPTLATEGNLNNDIGLPLTLCRLQDHDYAVVEMGANHPGEIHYLSTLAQPQVAILNNAGRAHLEGFGSVAGVARAKAEILDGLAAGGTFIYNADDPHAPLWRRLAGERTAIGFGSSENAQVRSPAHALGLHWDEGGFHSEFPVITPQGSFQVRLALTGEHNRLNALAAIAAAQALGVPQETILAGLAEVKPVAGRLCPRMAPGGVRLVDDSYNANPDSVCSALEVLCQAPGRRLLALGDLGELGEQSARLHAEIGERARARGVDLLFTCGRSSAATSRAFGSGGRHFPEHASLIEALRAELRPGDTLLVKGSRAARMEKVVEALMEEVSPC